MKITYKTVALFSLAVLLPATAYMKADPDSFLAQDSSVVLVSHDTDVKALQEKQHRYQEQLREQSELVDQARQDAISAGIQGDGAQAYIYAYQDEQAALDRMQAALNPQIEQLRSTIAGVVGKDSQTAALSQNADSRSTKNSDGMGGGKAVDLRAASK